MVGLSEDPALPGAERQVSEAGIGFSTSGELALEIRISASQTGAEREVCPSHLQASTFDLYIHFRGIYRVVSCKDPTEIGCS